MNICRYHKIVHVKRIWSVLVSICREKKGEKSFDGFNNFESMADIDCGNYKAVEVGN